MNQRKNPSKNGQKSPIIMGLTNLAKKSDKKIL